MLELRKMYGTRVLTVVDRKDRSALWAYLLLGVAVVAFLGWQLVPLALIIGLGI